MTVCLFIATYAFKIHVYFLHLITLTGVTVNIWKGTSNILNQLNDRQVEILYML